MLNSMCHIHSKSEPYIVLLEQAVEGGFGRQKAGGGLRGDGGGVGLGLDSSLHLAPCCQAPAAPAAPLAPPPPGRINVWLRPAELSLTDVWSQV